MDQENQQSEESSFESAYNDTPTETPASTSNVETKQEVQTPAADPIKEMMARFDKIEASHNTLAGHIGGLNRTQKELQERLAAATAATKTVADAPTQSQVRDAMSDPAEWIELKKQFPEWAIATESIIDARVRAKGIDEVAIEKIVVECVAQQTGDTRKEMIDTYLDSIVDGDWQKEVSTEAFKKWFETQPDDIKALGDSKKMTDAAKMLRLFEASKSAKPFTNQQQVTTRQKRVEAAVTPRGTGGHSGGSNTEEDYMQSAYSS